MKISRLAASILALALFVGPLAAQPGMAQVRMAAAEILPPAVQVLLADKRPVGEMTDAELQKRLRQANQLSQLPQLPPPTLKQLRNVAAQTKAELARRKSGAQAAGAATADGGNTLSGAPESQATDVTNDQGGAPVKKTVKPATQGLPKIATAFVADQRDSTELDEAALTNRIGAAQKILALATLPPKFHQVAAQRLAADKAQLRKLRMATAAKQGGPAQVGQSGDGQPADGSPSDGGNADGGANNGGAADGGNSDGGNANGGNSDGGQVDGGNTDGGNAGGGDQADGGNGSNLLMQVTHYLNQTRNPGAMKVPALKAAIADGNTILGTPNLPPQVKQQVSAVQKSLRNVLQQKLTATDGAPGGDAAGGGNGQGTDNQTGGNPFAAATQRYFRDATDPARLGDDRLIADIALGERLNVNPQATDELKTRIANTQKILRGELQRRKTAQNGQPDPNGGPAPVINPGDEAKANAILNDDRDAQTMNLIDLRNRVNGIRGLLQRRQLSPDTTARLRVKLDVERVILRDRMAQDVAVSDGDPGGQPDVKRGPGPGGPPDQLVITDQDFETVRHDHRPPRDLRDDELRFRINIFVNILSNNVYPEDRYDWERRLELDRQVLRERMLEERARREAELRRQREKILLDQQRAQYDDLAAAEASDRELQDTLAAAPRRTFDRRYTIDDLENNADLRAALPRIEIDTIHFGFNEAFVREEEVNNLDRVAQVMERILASNPNEVFLIEGHTDASGSDFYNLGLSRQRAQAVMQALTTYYVIPTRNLRTVGYGERYLKIPVAGPEAENRRVSVSRITDVVGMD